jgi:hypothetical protein
VKTIIAQFVPDKKQDQHGGSEAETESCDIDKRVGLVTKEMTQGSDQVISVHAGKFYFVGGCQ